MKHDCSGYLCLTCAVPNNKLYNGNCVKCYTKNGYVPITKDGEIVRFMFVG